jgi:glucokinase
MLVLGIDLGGTNVRVGLADGGKIIRVEEMPLVKTEDEWGVLNCIYELIDRFADEAISGIGIGVPSVVDPEKGIVYDVQNIPSWKEVHLKELLEEKYKLPVYVNNDANCFAAGEKYFGKAINYSDCVGLILGTGVGAGLIINNKLYSGTNCGAGEFGMLAYKDKNYEAYCSGQFFEWKYKTDGGELYRRAESGEPEALEIFSEFGSHVGEVIKVIVYSIDPEIIVLGGSGSKSFRFFRKQMWKTLESFGYPKSIEKLKIEVSETEQGAILGAAALYYNAFGGGEGSKNTPF